jgi:hypothetical protein
MGTSKNHKPNKEKRKMGGYDTISFINHFKFMETNFLYLNCFFALYKCNRNKHYILKTLMYTLWSL